ncbi:hypothetical protein GCM10009563_24310 [Subtercola frigoramans]
MPAGAFSVASSAAPLHSPPRPRPWAKRMTVSRMGAQRPIEAYVGRNPMSTVAMPMVRSDATRVFLRPIRSPKCPKMIEPMGRATNATPKTANEVSRPTLGSVVGKNSFGNTSTAAVA